MAKADTDRLRAIGLNRLESLGHSFNRIDQRRHRYRRSDGMTFSLATNMKRVLICTTDGTEATARLDFEDADYILFVAPREEKQVSKSDFDHDLYWLPSDVVADFARKDHEQFLATSRTKGNNTTWQQVFDDREDIFCHGYGKRYVQFLLK